MRSRQTSGSPSRPNRLQGGRSFSVYPENLEQKASPLIWARCQLPPRADLDKSASLSPILMLPFDEPVKPIGY